MFLTSRSRIGLWRDPRLIVAALVAGGLRTLLRYNLFHAQPVDVQPTPQEVAVSMDRNHTIGASGFGASTNDDLPVIDMRTGASASALPPAWMVAGGASLVIVAFGGLGAWVLLRSGDDDEVSA